MTNDTHPEKTQSILLGGLVVGLLSTSYLGLINMACCAGVLIGAVVTVWHYTDTNQLTLKPGEGASLGAMAAVVGGLIAIVLNFILIKMGIRADQAIGEFMLERFRENMPPEQYEEAIEKMNEPMTVANYLKSQWYGANLIIFAVFGAIGGAIGAALFKKGPERPDERA